jgi:hypothetical protein
MGDPFAGLLEGLSEGFQTGHGFREDIKARRRRRELEDRLAFLREQQEQRAAAEEGRQATTFGQQQTEYTRGQRLRTGAIDYAAAPDIDPAKPGTQRAPLTGELAYRQQVGRALGQFGGRDDVDDVTALSLGVGDIPASAVQPKRYYPTTRQEYLENYNLGPGRYRREPVKPGGMTRAQAELAASRIDRDYSKRNRFGGGIERHYLSPAQRETIIRKMIEGTYTEADLPDAGGAAPTRAPASQQFPTPSARPQERSLTDYLRGEPQSMRTAPAAPASPAAAAGQQLHSVLSQSVDQQVAADAAAAVDPDRVQRALQMFDEFPDLSIEDFEAALTDEGYSRAEISAVLRELQP